MSVIQTLTIQQIRHKFPLRNILGSLLKEKFSSNSSGSGSSVELNEKIEYTVK